MLRPLDAGRLDRRVALLRRTTAQNAYGEQVPTWTEFATVWAEKLDVIGREYFAAQQTQAGATTRWRMRYRSDLTELDRLSHGGVLYDIRNVAEIGRRDGIEIIADKVRQ